MDEDELYKQLGALKIDSKENENANVKKSYSHYIPETIRADGSVRKAIPIRSGFIPAEFVRIYKPPFKREHVTTAAVPPQPSKQLDKSVPPHTNRKSKIKSGVYTGPKPKATPKVRWMAKKSPHADMHAKKPPKAKESGSKTTKD